ncbi:MAG: hypothetical protein A2849_03875 [Candidatus Taylorbacteria bacterium RIFCSPHIGHO2_01_FULL_51_15]|uniref:Uncharacterized protein n=1 Tax=Candidatus Taylorbacteria bacterium RIFCSPHIGHO2_01_FULL_51_15 TaxID=1802304 RepID=A0A1G2MCU4_9BACT|nr:MAG: hypothetical protein A2849_03875 [Candidatus Taylorbacteria bacterium RIFCSPHIGHO2_01_FULL_51_15]
MEIMKTENTPPTAEPSEALTFASYRVNKVWLPKFLRLDAIEALRRARSFKQGDERFPGLKTATLELSEGIANQPESYFQKRQELVIGTGGGRFGKFGESATEAMTEFLGIEEDRPLQRITAAVRKTVEDAGSRTELPAIIRIMHRVINRHAVANYIIAVMHYVHHGLIHRRVKNVDDGTLLSFYEEMCGGKSPLFTDERACKSLRQLVQKSVERKNNSILELSAITDCLICEEGPKEGKKIVQNLLRGLYQDELLYWEAVDLCQTAQRHTVKTQHYGKETEIKAIFVQTDNPLIPHASHSKEVQGIGIVVVQNVAGNLAIYMDQKLPVSLVCLWQMIQTLELLASGWNPRNIPWQALKVVDTHADIQDKWKYIFRKKKIMNGFSQGDVPATAIKGEALLYAIQHAFHSYGVPKWMREQGIIARKRSVAHQPTSEAKPTDPSPEPATAAAGTNDLEEAINNAKPQKPRGRKTSSEKDEQAPVAA